MQMKSVQLLVAIALTLFTSNSLLANVKIYQFSGYKGKNLVCGPGEYSYAKFNHLFSKGSYCSIKLPKGFCIDVSYGGSWKRGSFKSYSSSVSKLKCGFKKIRIRVCEDFSDSGKGRSYPGKGKGRGYSGKGKGKSYSGKGKSYSDKGKGYPGKGKSSSEESESSSSSSSSSKNRLSVRYVPSGAGCDLNWALLMCKRQNYSGPSSCLPVGTHSYRPSSLGYPKSIKVRQGYSAVFKYKGKVVNGTTRNNPRFRWQFDEVIIKPYVPRDRKPLPGRGGRRPRRN